MSKLVNSEALFDERIANNIVIFNVIIYIFCEHICMVT